jgi:hypothetical protein
MKASSIIGIALVGAVAWLLYSQHKANQASPLTQGTLPSTLAALNAQNQATPQDEFSAALAMAGKFFNGVVAGINQAANGQRNYTP